MLGGRSEDGEELLELESREAASIFAVSIISVVLYGIGRRMLTRRQRMRLGLIIDAVAGLPLLALILAEGDVAPLWYAILGPPIGTGLLLMWDV